MHLNPSNQFHCELYARSLANERKSLPDHQDAALTGVAASESEGSGSPLHLNRNTEMDVTRGSACSLSSF